MNYDEEFERQVQTLVEKGYPELAGVDEREFREKVGGLRGNVNGLELKDVDLENGHLPFVIVVKSKLVPAEQMMSRVDKDGREGITKLFPHEPGDFEVIEEVRLPDEDMYLLVDIDRGKESLNVTPAEAMMSIRDQGRSPLTIDEGVAIVTQFPEFLMKNNCFSLLASRHSGDKRVPAIWINGKKHPNLGWCWEGNPHTWLGSASCGVRLG